MGIYSQELISTISSDIDLVVTFPPSEQVRLRRLASVLEADEICRDPHIIEHASVSISVCILRIVRPLIHLFIGSSHQV